MRAYFEDQNVKSTGVTLTLILMVAMGVAALIFAEQIITGWVALGERADISRRDINPIEIITIIGCLLFGFASFRTAWGIYTREEAGWSWAQWMSFAIVLVGVFLLMFELVPQGMSYISNLVAPDIDVIRLGIGVLIFGAGGLAYSFATRDVEADDSKVDKAQGAFTTATSDLTPSQFIRFQLAKSPSAGAIIGFVGILLIFSIATDLFLTETSIASILTNVSTKGIIAIGVTILMISGEFDLSVGSMLGAVSLFFMLFMTEGVQGVPGLDQPMSPFISMLLALAVAVFLGFINGIILVRTGIPSFIVTLGTLQIYRAIPLVLIPGGRILRYRDYYDTFPQLYFNRWLVMALVLFGLIALLYTAYKILPNLFNSTRHKWAIQHSNGHFGTVTALGYSVVGIVTTLIFAVVGVWLMMVIAYHFDLRNGDIVDPNTVSGQSRLVEYLEDHPDRQSFEVVPIEDETVTVDDDGGGVQEIEISLDNDGNLPDLSAYSSVTITPELLKVGFFEVANGRWQFSVLDAWEVPPNANFRNSIVWWAILLIIFHVVLTRTPYGNAVFAVGGNAGAARAQGINVNRVKIFNFMLVAFLVGIVAVLETARNPGVDPLKGEGWELEVIAMTVIGGALLNGGYGSVLGTLLGGLIFGMLQTGLVLAGMNARLFQGVVGAILIIAVVLNTTVRSIPKN